jgi:hypothetical protein
MYSDLAPLIHRHPKVLLAMMAMMMKRKWKKKMKKLKRNRSKRKSARWNLKRVH